MFQKNRPVLETQARTLPFTKPQSNTAKPLIRLRLSKTWLAKACLVSASNLPIVLRKSYSVNYGRPLSSPVRTRAIANLKFSATFIYLMEELGKIQTPSR